MDKLPYELYQIIFEYLDLSTVLKLKRVSKKFYFFIKHVYKIRELILSDEIVKGVWTDDKKLINFKNRLPYRVIEKQIPFYYYYHYHHYLHYKVSNCLGTLRKIKRLSLKSYDIEDNTIDMKQINFFQELEHLEIEIRSIISGKIRLYSLKFLKIVWFEPLPDLVIETPNLRTLFLDDVDKVGMTFEIVYPSSIRNLSIQCFKNYIQSFTLLETLEIRTEIHVDLNILGLLKNLKTIFFTDQDNTSLLYDFSFLYRKLKLIDKKPKIFFKFVPLNFNHSVIDCQIYKLKVNLKTKIIYDISDKSMYEINSNTISFTDLIELISFEMIKNNYNRFKDIEHISLNECLQNNQQNQLLKFIENCPNLSHLSFQKTKLKQNFFNKLPSISSLLKLTIKKNNYLIDLRFVMKMYYLAELRVYHGLDINQIDLNKLQNFKKLTFTTNKFKHKIVKVGNDKYKLKCKNLSRKFKFGFIGYFKYESLKKKIKSDKTFIKFLKSATFKIMYIASEYSLFIFIFLNFFFGCLFIHFSLFYLNQEFRLQLLQLKD